MIRFRPSVLGREEALNVARGYLMGAADVVPGVSGGTVALVLGIYERLVSAIRTAAGALGAAARGRGAIARRRFFDVEWSFVAAVLAGILLAVFSLARLIDYFLEEEPQNTAAVFFGLVAGSIIVARPLVERWTTGRLAAALAVAAAAFGLLGLRSDSVTDPVMILFFGAGAIAVVAMILPGISGSFILLMLGMYEAVIDSVKDLDLPVLGTFVIGAILGLSLFSTLLSRLLRDHHGTVIAMLIGLMTGSLRVLWPWPDGTENARLGAPDSVLMPLAMAAAGFAAVIVISRLSTGHGAPVSARYGRE